MDGPLTSTISAVVRELLAIYGESESYSSARFHRVLKFVLEQMDRMPWLLRFAIKVLTLGLIFSSLLHARFAFFTDGSGGNVFRKQIRAWSCSPLRPCRDLVKFYAAMVVLSLYSDLNDPDREGL